MQRVSLLSSHLTTPNNTTTTTSKPAKMSSPTIHLYTAQTPNGIKVSMLLEELGLPYEVTAIELSKNVQKEPWFLDINPNGRIPALTDVLPGGTPVKLFESGAIMQYLVDRYDTEHKVSYPRGTREFWEVNSWVCVYLCSLLLSGGVTDMFGCEAVLADGRVGADARVSLFISYLPSGCEMWSC
jgi:glutathione S-transferase